MASDDDARKSPSRRPPRPPAPAPAREAGTAKAAADDEDEDEDEDEEEEDEEEEAAAAAAFAPRRLSTELGAAVVEWPNIPERKSEQYK